MSDTPDTDNEERDFMRDFKVEWAVDADFARQLERELAEARAELKRKDALIDSLVIRSDAFGYLAWLEDRRDSPRGASGCDDYLVMASDGTTCWGKTYLEAVRIAEQHDRGLFDAAEAAALAQGGKEST